MTTRLLELILRTTNQGDLTKTNEQLSQFKNGIGGAIQELTGFNLTSIGVAGAITGIAAGLKKATEETLKYAEQVRDLSRISGASAEETSRLIQTADDLKVEYSTLEQAAKALAKEGIALTTEELAKSADEYANLTSAGERAEYATKKFGRAGLELTKILEVGGDALREMAGAQNSNLIMTEAQAKKARELEIAMDTLEDTIQGVKYAIGNELIPVLADAASAFSKLITWADELDRVLAKHNTDVLKTAGSYEDYVAEMYRAAAAAGMMNNLRVIIAGAVKGEAGQIEVLTEMLGWETEATFAAGQAKARYEEDTRNATKADQDFETILSQRPATLQAAWDSFKDYSDRVKSATDYAIQPATMSMDDFYKAVMAPLQGGAYKDMAEELFNVNDKMFDFSWRLSDLQQKLKDGQITYDEYKQKVKDLRDELRGITSEEFTLKLRADFTDWERALDYANNLLAKSGVENTEWWRSLHGGNGATPTPIPVPIPTPGNGGQEGGSGGRYSSGGSFVIPPGFPNDTYPLGMGRFAQSGETVTVTPAPQNYNANFTGNVYITNGGDVATLAKQITEHWQRMSRN